MSKFKDFFGGAVANLIAPYLKTLAKQYFKLAWDKLREKDAAAHKTSLISIYPSVDVHLEKLTEKTGTKLDDALVSAWKESIEDSARESGFVLPNLDSD